MKRINDHHQNRKELQKTESKAFPQARIFFVTRRAMILVLAMFCSTSGNPAQSSRSGQTGTPLRITNHYPSVYITFERVDGVIESSNTRILQKVDPREVAKDQSSEKEPYVWLRLHNNSRWALTFTANSFYAGSKATIYRLRNGSRVVALDEGKEVSFRYQIEDATGRNIGVSHKSDMSFGAVLPPGRSILFSVSRQHLASKQSIYLRFRYEWETSDSKTGLEEPEHRVYFHGSNLSGKPY